MAGDREMVQLPEAFLQRVKGQLGAELPAFLSAMEASPIRGLRMNPFRAGYETPFRDAGSPVLWVRGGFELPMASGAGTTIAHEAGAFYLQEPCAMLPAAVMDARPGETILDLCAAPGGKSTQLGADMAGCGLLVSNEPVPGRAAILSRNMERMGIENSIVTSAWPEQLSALWPEAFDGVLVDAPCSGEGMFRRHPESRAEWTPEKAAGCAERQRQILREAAKMVRPGGRLVYSTCTWNPEENERQVLDFLREHPDFEMSSFQLPGVDGREGFFTCWLHRTRGEGQFVALMRRKGEGEARLPDGSAAFRLPADMIKIWRDSGIRTEEPSALFGQTLVRAPQVIPTLKGVKVLRIGKHLGQVKGKLFLPDHAAAMGQHRLKMPETVLSDKDALRYLSGETVAGEAKGWTLMTWHDLTLGWGKGSGGVIKNHYPKGLRNGKLTV